MSKTIKEVLDDIYEKGYNNGIDRIGINLEARTSAALSEIEQIIRECEPERRTLYGPANENGDYPPEEYENGGFNQAVDQYTNILIERIKGE